MLRNFTLFSVKLYKETIFYLQNFFGIQSEFTVTRFAEIFISIFSKLSSSVSKFSELINASHKIIGK